MPSAEELLALNQRLLNAIAAGDWKSYEELCHPKLTCFEPEAQAQLVEGMAFHKFYFDVGGNHGPRNTTMASPVVKFLGDDVALVAYARLIQRIDSEGRPKCTATLETRIWHREAGRWRHVHFHRSTA
jgi:calcium/calmodulin-dependent protein kinase (CaM kinase) II